MTMHVTQDGVRTFLIQRLRDKLAAGGVDPAAVPPDFDLYREGIIDSFGMLEMIMALEDRFGAKLDYVNMSPEDLTNIDKLAAHVVSSCSS
jgi:acyl carrier protein